MLVKNYLQTKDLRQEATRSGFGRGLVLAGQKDKHVVALTADLAESTKVLEFSRLFPQRFFDLGVAEQNLAGVSAGLALSGKIPFMTSYGVFSPGRNWDQIRVSICYNQANVKIASSHAGLTVGADGATHQALEDIALMRVLPHMTVLVPADANQALVATVAAAKHVGPVYLRLYRPATPIFLAKRQKFIIGKAQVLLPGSDVTLIACGPLVYQALQAAHQLRLTGVRAGVVNCHTIKPLDRETIVRLARISGAVVTIEEHQQAGGLGSAIAEALSQACPVPQEFVAVSDTFGESGTAEELLKRYHLTTTDILRAVKKVMHRK